MCGANRPSAALALCQGCWRHRARHRLQIRRIGRAPHAQPRSCRCVRLPRLRRRRGLGGMDQLPGELLELIAAALPTHWRPTPWLSLGPSVVDAAAPYGPQQRRRRQRAVTLRCISRRLCEVLPLASLLLRRHGGEEALLRAAGAGRVDVVTSLLRWREHGETLRADTCCGQALVEAARGGHADVVRLLLSWPKHAPRADSQDSEALVEAASGGHSRVMRLLLEHPEHPARADCQDCEALLSAARGGHMDAMQLLLRWHEHAPPAGCFAGAALRAAAASGQVGTMRMLLEWQEEPPRADCLDGTALVWAASGGHVVAVRLLLDWPEHAPSATCQSGEAVVEAACNGHEDVLRLLMERSADAAADKAVVWDDPQCRPDTTGHSPNGWWWTDRHWFALYAAAELGSFSPCGDGLSPSGDTLSPCGDALGPCGEVLPAAPRSLGVVRLLLEWPGRGSLLSDSFWVARCMEAARCGHMDSAIASLLRQHRQLDASRGPHPKACGAAAACACGRHGCCADGPHSDLAAMLDDAELQELEWREILCESTGVSINANCSIDEILQSFRARAKINRSPRFWQALFYGDGEDC
eukprot:364618-Chlamydomonas_euryale.AAC.2